MSGNPKKKDGLLILAVIAVAAALLLVSRLMPRGGLDGRVAEQTLAPDAVTYLDETPSPAPEETGVPQAPEEPEATEAPRESEAPEATETPQSQGASVAGPMPKPQTDEVRGYVVLTVNGRQYGDPIAMDRDKVITIRQDSGEINQVHITPQEVYMESSTCANQDCVGQGHVTLDNIGTRILSGYIICLPNAVTIELVPEN